MPPLRGLTRLLLGVGGLAGGVAAARAWRRVDVVEVRGRSMAPTLLPGDRLLIVRARRAPRPGDVVVAADPRGARRELIKRVTSVDGGRVALHGDAPDASTDSRHFGSLPLDAARWRVVARYWPLHRAGRLPAAPLRAPVSLHPIDEGGEPACAFPEALIAGD